jgi:hypothetical protein
LRSLRAVYGGRLPSAHGKGLQKGKNDVKVRLEYQVVPEFRDAFFVRWRHG